MIPAETLIADFEKWLKSPYFEFPYSDLSIAGYSANIGMFLRYLDSEGIDGLDDVSLNVLRNWIVRSKTGIAPVSTQNVRFAAVNLFFQFLQNERGFPFNPAHVLREEKRQQSQKRAVHGGRGGYRPKRLPPVLDRDDIHRLLMEAKRYETIAGYRDAALVDFLLATGLRAHEAAAFRLDALNGYLSGSLRVIGKGNKERLIRFPPPPKETLELWLYARKKLATPAETLFVSDQGKAMSAAMLYMIIRRLLDRAGIHKPQSGPHLLRHTAASLWLAGGLDLRQVQENMGHSSIVVTSRYLHLVDSNHGAC